MSRLLRSLKFTDVACCCRNNMFVSLKATVVAIMFVFWGVGNASAQDPTTVVDIIVGSEVHNTLETAVVAAGLADDLSGPGPFTVFAPTDDAFAALPAGVLNALLDDPNGLLVDVLLYHVVSGQALSNSLSDGQSIETLLGEDVLVTINDDGVFINGAEVIVVDLLADNGVVHVIDAVLTEFLCSLSIDCPADVTLECGDDINDLDLTGMPSISNSACFGDIVVTHSDALVFADGSCLVVYTRTWVASVVGGPSVMCTQTITVQDTQGPVFLDAPADASYQCISEVPQAQELETTDCGGNVDIVIFEPDGTDSLNCTLSTPVGPGPDWAVWLNGLTSLGLASNDYYRWVPGTATMVYNVDGTAYLTGTVENMTNTAEQWVVHFWMQNGQNWSDWSAQGRSYKNDLGFGTSTFQDWTYYELVPVFSHFVGAGTNAGSELYLSHQPANFYFGFQFGVGANNRNGNDGGSGWFYYWGNVNGEPVSDHGDVTVDKECVPVEIPNEACEDIIQRFWAATDECGNVSFADQIITIQDTTPPVFSNCPESLTIECGSEIPAAVSIDDLVAVDNCAGPVTIEYLGELVIPGEDNCSYAISRRYRAIDECFNDVECNYFIYVEDTTAPVLTVPADATFECDEEIVFGQASATDVCQGEVDVMMGEPVFYEDDCYGYWIVTYTANDGCGNVATGTQTISIEDTTAPVFEEFEAQIYVECTEVDEVEIPGATDNCDLEVEVTYVDITNSGGCLGVIMRTFTAEDECGNTSEAVQYIYIQDTTPAVIDEPADMTVECSEVPEAPGAEGADIYDNCGYDVTVEFRTEMVEGECEDSYTILWIWEALDYCENFSTDTTVITVVDTTDPMLEVPQGGMFDCDEEIVYGQASATDNCDEDVEITFSDATTPGECPQEFMVVRTWTATDNCGNVATGSATYYVVDEEAPVFTSVPENLTIECDDEIPATSATAEDNCSEVVTITSNDVYEVQGECYSLIIRTFTAEDDCGNMSTASHTITILDTTAPVINGEFNINLPCEDYFGIFVTATDNCDENVTITVVGDEEVSGGCAGRYIRTYLATDNCQNTSTFEQFITLIDETDPVISNPPTNITVECGDDIPAYEPIWTDNCDDDLDYSAISSIAMEGCNQIITQVYFATDHCNNEASVERVITIVDTTDPYFGELPENITIECDVEVPAIVVPMAYDICDEEVDVEVSDEIIPGQCPNEYTIARVYRAYDDCGNEAVETRFIYVEDNFGPVFDEQAFLYSYECDEEIPVIEPTAEDACGSYEIDYVDFWFEESDCAGYMTRIWTAIDECGNESEFAQFINIFDETAPVITGEIEIDLPCEDFTGIYVTATDNCDEDVEIIVVSDEEASGGCAGRYIRTYRAYDECDNFSEFQQFITLVDETAPVASVDPQDASYECDEEWSPAAVIFTDNCDDELVLTANVQIEDDGCTMVYHYIWTAIDHCQNATTVDQYVTITDETAPVASFDPEDFTVECGSFWDLLVPTFSDNCDEVLELASSVSEEMVGCNTVITYSWSATDNCGNTTTVGNTVTIEDTTPPNLEVPFGGSFSCDEEIEYGMAYAYDLCDGDVEITFSDAIIPGECPQSYTIERTYVATDDCDNFSSAVVEYFVFDNDAPEFTFVPADVTIECSDEVPASSATAVDNCDEDVDVSQSDMIDFESDCYTVIVREFVAEDDCGNMAYAYQNIYVVDTTDPIITGEVEITMPCDEVSMEIFVTATDNCDENVEISILSDEAASGSCAGRIIRTYIAYDNCQNWSTFTQYITLIDNEAPVASIDPIDLIVECGDEFEVAEVSFTDNCDDELTLTANVTITEQDECTLVYQYIWTAIDHCENVTVVDQIITIQDTTDPVIYDQDSESTVACNVVIDFATPSAWDACDEDVEVIPTITTEPGECPGEFTQTITFTAFDDCGNSSSVTHIVNYVDEEAPMLTNIPEGGNFECDEDLPMDMPSAFDYCSEATVVSDEYIIEGQCPNSYTVVRVFSAIDECGNSSDEIEVYYNVFDETDPYFTSEVSDESYECLDWDTYEAQSVTAMDNCSEPTVTVEIEPLETDNCGNGIWEVVYTATDACWNATSISYTITVLDETAPVLSEQPADLMLNCGDELPEAPMVTASDNCDEIVNVTMTETCMGDCPEEGEEECEISTPVRPAGNPCLYPVDWAMALFAMPSAHKWYQLVPGSGSFVDNGDGSITISGTLVNAYNANAGFTFSVNFVNGLDWAAWSSQAFPTGFKADCGGEAANHPEWMYYILQASQGAELVGWGDYDGSLINLTHAPANLYFGFQYGDGANNYNGVNGFGGWFSYNGTLLVNDEPIMSGNASGAGDFAFEVDCCPDYTIERCWTAMDCTGNTTTWCQTISYGDLDSEVPAMSTQAIDEDAKVSDIAIVSIQPNPANANSQISFMSQSEGRLSLQIMDMTGRIVADLFNSDVQAGVVYKTDFDASALPAGIYMVRLNSGTQSDIDRLQIAK
jgi:hypothetical protein